MRLFYILMIIPFFIISCQSSEDSKQLGQMLGGTLGAIVGSKFGSGTGKTIYTIIGGAGGFIIGGKLASILSQSEKNELNKLTQESLEKDEINESSLWKSKEKNNLSAEIAPVENFTLNEHSCRKFKQTIINEDIKEVTEAKACRDNKGNWQILEN